MKKLGHATGWADTKPPQEIYLDNQATTPCDPSVVAAMLPYFTDTFANAASAEHAAGRRAFAAVEQARCQLAALLGVEPREIVFTSGATEANNLAIKGFARSAKALGDPRRRLVTVATEHKCVLESTAALTQEGFEVIVLPVSASGRLDLGLLEQALAVPSLLVSIMGANNETGVLQDLAAVGAIAERHGAAVHSDLAQLAGKLPVSVAESGLALASLSAHKMYGPKGIGALYVRRRPRTRLAPLLSGGSQERGLRAGTAPVALIVGFGTAAAVAADVLPTEAARLRNLRERLRSALIAAIPGLVINGSLDHRLPGNLSVTFPEANAELVMAACPLLCVSSGSACSAGSASASHVLKAMGVDDAACRRSLRLGIGRFNSAEDIDRTVSMLLAAHAGSTPSSDGLRHGHPVHVASGS